MTTELPQAHGPRTESDIREWLVTRLASALHVEPGGIDTGQPLIGLGLDSMQFVVLVGELEDWLGCRFTDNPLMDYPTIDELAPFLAERVAHGDQTIDPTAS